MKRNILIALLLGTSLFSLTSCGEKPATPNDWKNVSTVKKVTWEEDDSCFTADVQGTGAQSGTITLQVKVVIDKTKNVVSKASVSICDDSAAYGKALLLGNLETEKAKAFYDKYVNIPSEGLSFKVLDKMDYSSRTFVQALFDNKEVEVNADLKTGATATAAAYINFLKAAVNVYRTKDAQ